jgi:hypothetical protein
VICSGGEGCPEGEESEESGEDARHHVRKVTKP